ncbi:CE1759 family FMN reductase [Actinacidiphila glaucinigra]|uniref:CE1759 family FMN reductase n=1 Tax=Actinacidiphila glaucinigra TaxID=235986 RepID=UPI002DD7B4D8|nr:CE1759 family FMN reductase [Actinacidiphila glaucinigra]WSD64318.1 NAD(P)H-dependent oxidoreductase [Actinacidiphila glaucinigra]
MTDRTPPQHGPERPAGAPLALAVISGGTGNPSSSRLLADRLTEKTAELIRGRGRDVTIDNVELAPIAVDIAQAVVTGFPGERLRTVIRRLAAADGLITVSPVYTAGVSGLFKSFFDILDNDLLVAKPALPAATAGSARHALVVDGQLRPMLAFLRALAVPTSVFAAPEDWGSSALGERIGRAATELTALMTTGVGAAIAGDAWSGYQHRFGGEATRAERTAADVDFESPLMRLAAGGSPSRRDSGA